MCVCVWARAGGGSCVNLGAVRTDGKWGGPQAERDVLSGGGGRILATLGKGMAQGVKGGTNMHFFSSSPEHTSADMQFPDKSCK